jgi:hypothetical protein
MCLRRHHRLLRHALAHEPSLVSKTIYDMAGNSFTMRDVERQMSDLLANADELIREARERAHGRGTSDARPTRPFPSALPNAPRSETGRLMETFEEERLAEWFDITDRLGPISYELPHFDGKPTVHQFIVHVGKARKTGEPHLSVFVTDHFVFLPLTGASIGRLNKVQFQPLIDRNIRFFAQALGMCYTTRDQQYVFDLLAILDAQRRPELDRSQLGRQRSSLFDRMIWAAMDDVRRYTQMSWLLTNSGEHRSYSLGSAFIMHSNPSIYYLPFNWSVWRMPYPMNFLGGERADPQHMVYRPMSEVEPQLTREELRDTMIAGAIRRRVWKEQGVDLYD